MKPVALLLSAALLAAPFSHPALAGLPIFDSQGAELPTLAPMLERSTPAVVNIFTRTRVAVRQNPLFSDPFFRHFFDLPTQPRERIAQSLGSGVIVDADEGYIITNHHVVERADEISVNLRDGRTLTAEVVGSDPEADVAVLKVPADGLSALPLADSDKLRVGDFVVAIGNPFGLGQTVTSGIVSALGRTGLGIEGYEDFIQTDASINPGNSGGALVNLRGELIGINTAILSKSGGNVGIGFAIPINMTREIMAQLIEHGEVRRGQLGAGAQDLTPELASAFGMERGQGAVITQIVPGSPADKAGLRAGDVVTEVNGRSIRSGADLRNAVGLVRVGQKVDIGLLREGKPMKLRVVVSEPELAKLEGAKISAHLTGALLANAGEAVEVVDIDRNSPAWRSGLRKGDVIAQANRRPVSDLDSLARAVAGSNTLLLNIQRGGGALFVLIR